MTSAKATIAALMLFSPILADATPVPYQMIGQITVGVVAGETHGTYAGHIGDNIGMFLSVDTDISNSDVQSQNTDGNTVYEYHGAGYFGTSFFFDIVSQTPTGLIGEADHTTMTLNDDVELTGIYIDGQILSGEYDILEFGFLSFDRGPDIETENTILLIGTSDWLQVGVQPVLAQAVYAIGQLVDYNYVTDTEVGFARFQIGQLDSTAVVPVPAAVWLFCSALVGLLGIRRA